MIDPTTIKIHFHKITAMAYLVSLVSKVYLSFPLCLNTFNQFAIKSKQILVKILVLLDGFKDQCSYLILMSILVKICSAYVEK